MEQFQSHLDSLDRKNIVDSLDEQGDYNLEQAIQIKKKFK